MAGSNRFFWKYSGEDIGIIALCNHRGIRDRFALVGAVTLFVFATSFLSCWYSFQMLFDNIWMAVPIAFFFAWMINNIYLVLLTTLAKPVLKIKYQGVIKHLSLTLRISFIVFFAVFISKPLEAWFFEPLLSQKVELIKQKEIATAQKNISVASAKDEKALVKEIARKEKLGYGPEDVQPLRDQIGLIKAQHEEAMARMAFVIGRADYFVQRLEILTGGGVFMLSWIFTLSVVCLFLLPVYLKRKINTGNPYFQIKREVYDRIVREHYGFYLSKYSEIFHKKYGLTVGVTGPYLDPPYNTEKITDQRKFSTQDDFFKLYS